MAKEKLQFVLVLQGFSIFSVSKIIVELRTNSFIIADC